MTDRERLFDWCVDQVQAGRMTLDECAERYASDDPDLADMLRTVGMLRDLTIPDTRVAKLRVRARLAASMSGGIPAETVGPHEPGGGRAALTPPPISAHTTPRPRMRRAFAGLAAAALLACGLLGLGAGQAAADALPGNPLYAVKRAEEWVTLQTAFSDTRRGVVLATLAEHRLAEAAAEAGEANVSEVRVLLREHDDDVGQAVVLSAAMEARGEDARPVLSAVAIDLAHAQQLQVEATSQGNGTFAQLLQTSVANDQQMIHDNHLALPDVTVPPNGQGQSTASPGSRGRQGTSTAAPSSSSTENAGGKGNGNGSGHDHGTPTPSASPPGH